MEPVLLGLVSPAVQATGNALDRTAQAVVSPFAALLRGTANLLDRSDDAVAHNETDGRSAKGIAGSEDSLLRKDVSLNEMQAAAASLEEQLARRVQELLSEAGIQFNGPLRIAISEADGTIELLSDHQQKALLETVLSNDPELAAELHELVALERLLAFAENHEEFRAAFDDNPLGAIAEYRLQLDRETRVELEVAPPARSEYQLFG